MNCTTKGCERPARCAIRTQRPKRDDLRVTIYFDERVAPKVAAPYCKTCARALVPDLMMVIDNDAEEAADATA